MIAMAAVVVAPISIRAQASAAEHESEHEPLPNFDQRLAAPPRAPLVAAPNLRSAAATTSRGRGEAELRGVSKNVRIDRDEITGAAAFIGTPHEFLTGPEGAGRAVPAARLTRVSPGDPHRVVKAFIDEYAGVFGHGSEVLATARVSRDYVTPHNGLRTVDWQQYVDDILVFEAGFQAHLTARGELVNVSSHLIANPQQAAERGAPGRAARIASPSISAQAAVQIAATAVGAETSADAVVLEVPADGADAHQQFHAPTLLDAEARYVWLPMDGETLRLCWQVICTTKSDKFMYRVIVDAETGAVHLRQSLTEHLSNASYRVFTSDSPSPFSPGLSVPSTFQAPLVGRTLVTTSALDTTASPNGWIDDGVMETRGNNVDAHTDIDANNIADLPRPQATGPDRVFDPPLDLTQDPSTYRDAAVVNLFYWCNFMHDKLYALGFTEAAGNFQNLNFGKGGVGNDAVQADAQDGSGTDNANFSTPPDGSPGRMQMYVFVGPTPHRDGDFDAEVVLHEYTHGLSNRLVGGGVGISALQPRGMGEGWSDFYATSLLSDPSDDVNGNYAAGAYASYQLGGLTQNYYFGIRRYPYTTDITKNPLTLKDIDPAQASLHPGIPRSPIAGSTANEVHNMGEVWCVTLWDCRAKLINKYGAVAGNQLMLQLTTDGMKLSPANPNFLQARDAIIQADLVDTGGANRIELWSGFAKRGMGFSAFSPTSSSTSGIVEAFDLPDDLTVNPATPFAVTANIGGPYPTRTYTLTNTGAASLSWTAANTQPWLTLDLTSGTLAPGASATVTVSFTASANTLPLGTYSDTLTFTNVSDGRSFTRAVSLSIQPPPIISFNLDTDPGWTRTGEWAFGHPTGGGGTAHGFHDPSNGATGANVFGINLNGDYVITTGPAAYLTAGPYDFTGYANTLLQFQRWLNTDYIPFVTETIEVSRNGTTWTKVWDNGSSAITSNAWTKVQHDISAVADNQPTVYIRWGHQVTSTSGVFAYSGWNIDDVELLGQTGAAAPTITTQPASQTAAVGDNVVFTVSATGLPVPSYQWSFNGAQISGATSPTLVLNNVQIGNVGTYTVKVSNSVGSVTSLPATLSGTAPLPTIVTPPSNITVTAGQSATLSVEATDTEPLSYQWRRNGFPIPGATNSSFTLPSASRTDADYYDVIVGAGLSVVTLPPVRLSVAPAAYVTSVAPDPNWDLQAEISVSSTGYAAASLSDGRFYLAGQFSNINGARRMGIVRLTADGLNLDTTFAPPEIDNTIRLLGLQNDGKVVIAGDFLRVGGLLRPHLARLNSDGSVDTSFAPALGLSGPVFAIAVQSDGKILVGGSFGAYPGTARNFFVRLNGDGSVDPSFLTLGFTSTVNTIQLQGDGKILVGGSFTNYFNLNGVATPRARLARLNGDGTLDTTFNLIAGPNSTVGALGVQADGKVVAGGSFTTVGLTPTGGLARFNGDGSLDTGFTSSGGTGFNLSVNSIVVQADGRILAGGSFSTYGVAPINRLARLNSDGTLDTTFLTLGFNSTVYGLALQSTGQILVAGLFTSYLNPSNLSTSRSRFARLNPDGTLDSSLVLSLRMWANVNGLASYPGGKLLVTGSINFIRGRPSPFGLARLDATGAVDPTFSPGTGPSGTVYAAAVQPDGKIVITGFFSSYNGSPMPGIARLNTDGGLDKSFNPGTGLSGGNALVVLPGGRIFVGGSFTTAAGAARGRVAVFNSDGALDPAFAAGIGANSTVYAAVAQPDGKIIIGGNFTLYNGSPAIRIARLNPDGTLDPTFILGTGGNSDVSSIALQPDGKIVVGGFFSVFNAASRSGVVRLNPNGVVDSSFVPPPLGGVNSLIVQEDGRVLVRGSFTSVGGAPATAYLARLNPDGSRDTTFASGGFADSSLRPSLLVLRDDGQIAMQSNGAAALSVTQNAGAPVILSSPSNQVATVGDTVTFSVTATHSPLPSSYQWIANGVALAGATDASLVLTNVQLSQAGTYAVIVKNELGVVASASATLTVNKATALVALGNLTQTFDGTPRPITVTTEPAGLPVMVTYDGSGIVPTNAGSYAVSATIVDLKYEGSAIGTLTIAKATADLALGGLNTVYDGTAKAATVTTTPANLAVTLTYNGSPTPPSGAGSYEVVATVDDPNYAGTATGSLVIGKASAAVVLGDLASTYDGSPKPVSVSTLPSGLAVSVTYDGSTTPPSAPGSYAVVGTVSDANYAGSANATLVIAKGTATVTLSNLSAIYDGTPKPATATTDPAGLAVSFTYNGGATPPTYPGSYDVVATVADDHYTGTASGTLTVAITALVRHAPLVNGGLDGSVQVLLPESLSLNGSTWIAGDLLLPGAPALQINGHPTFGATRNAKGSAVPSNYQVFINGGATLRYLVRQVDAIALPTVDAPPPPAGTRSVFINTESDPVGSFATLRDLTLNGNTSPVAIPPGTYGKLISNANGGFVLGLAGATTPAVYNLQGLTLSGNSPLVVLGPVIINLASGPSFAVSVGSATHPEWLTVNIASGGLTLNGGVSFNGYVVAPAGTVAINGGATLHGGVISDRLSINGNGLVVQPAK